MVICPDMFGGVRTSTFGQCIFYVGSTKKVQLYVVYKHFLLEVAFRSLGAKYAAYRLP